MTNLDRLKGTPYLLDGFESFLREWLSIREGPSEEPFPWDEEQMALFRRLPREVQRFYEIVRRWPQAELASLRAWDSLAYPPRKPSVYIHSIGEWATEKHPSRLVLLQNRRATWRVEVAIQEENRGQLFTDAGQDGEDLPEGESIQMAVSPEEFLVTYALRELILARPLSERRSSALERASCVFHGRYHVDRELEFLYSPERSGWIWMREKGRVVVCAKKP